MASEEDKRAYRTPPEGNGSSSHAEGPGAEGTSRLDGSENANDVESNTADEDRINRVSDSRTRQGEERNGFGGGTGEKGSAERRHFSINGLLLATAGADPDWFQKNRTASEEQRKLRNQGLIIWITTTFAALSSYYFFASFFGDGTFVGDIGGPIFAILLTIVWAATIFAVDRAMLMTMLGSEGRRFVPAISRLLLAAAIGVIIAHPLKVQIFQPEIRSVFERLRAQYFVEQDRLQRALRNELRNEIISQFPNIETFDRAVAINEAITQRQQELAKLSVARRFEISGGHPDFDPAEVIPGEDVTFTLPLLSSPISVSVSTDPLNADPSDPSAMAVRCRTTNLARQSNVILQEIERRYIALLNRNQSQSHRLVVSAAESQQLQIAFGELTAYILEQRRYLPGGRQRDNGQLLNCDLFAWAVSVLNDVIEDYRLELQQLGIEPRLMDEFLTGLASIRQFNNAALASQICIVPMRNYSVADQERDRRSVQDLEDGALAEIRDRIFDPLRDQNVPLPNQESRWIAFLCAQSYPAYSFMWQTAILFDLTSVDRVGLAPASEIGSAIEQSVGPVGEPITPMEDSPEPHKLLAAGIFPPGTAVVASVAITLIFVLVEILPLLSKLYSRPGPYELSVAHKNRRASLDFADHKESPQEEAERRKREASAKYFERQAIQTAEAILAFRALVLQKKAEISVSDLPEEVIRAKLRGLDQSLEDFIREAELSLDT